MLAAYQWAEVVATVGGVCGAVGGGMALVAWRLACRARELAADCARQSRLVRKETQATAERARVLLERAERVRAGWPG